MNIFNNKIKLGWSRVVMEILRSISDIFKYAMLSTFACSFFQLGYVVLGTICVLPMLIDITLYFWTKAEVANMQSQLQDLFSSIRGTPSFSAN